MIRGNPERVVETYGERTLGTESLATNLWSATLACFKIESKEEIAWSFGYRRSFVPTFLGTFLMNLWRGQGGLLLYERKSGPWPGWLQCRFLQKSLEHSGEPRGFGSSIFFFNLVDFRRRSTPLPLLWFPKFPNPSLLKDFRRCNTIQKCIAKILANRMKIVLPCLVGKFQTAFVKGRRIGDNILLVQELFRNYRRDKGSPDVL